MFFPSAEEVATVKERYPAGTRVRLISMDDPYSKLQPGDEEKNTNNLFEPQNDFLKKGSKNDYYAPKELYKNEKNLFEAIQKNDVTYNKKYK